ncbi:MAG: TRAP transporter fused permease subunit [Hyphomicrobiales bacterium]|nr:TRAP transporter fused permease subunit [Hyphomicrobiales bacterium]MCP5372840.1 TRAP transporter fused permease subunit [Hyphomicrobiales bacterium]
MRDVPAGGQPMEARVRGAVAAGIGIAISLAAFYMAGFGIFDETLTRVGLVSLGLILVVTVYPLDPATGGLVPGAAWIRVPRDLAMVAVIAFSAWHFFAIRGELDEGLYDLTTFDQLVGAAALVVLLDLTRRMVGLPLALICIACMGYALFGEQLPWIFRHAGFYTEDVLTVVWYSFDGVFGRPVAVITSMILIFVVFGAILEGIGAGDVLLKLAFRTTGRLRGGPAHAAVVASALFGTMSGSTVANVVGTGVFTIPVVRKRGFSATFAGAIEAAASSGGQFMPPVMGAVAFIMADVTGVPYLTICIAALMPALFYYGSLFCAVSVEARRLGIEPVAEGAAVALTRSDWIMTLTFAVPLVVVVGALVAGRSAAMGGFLACLTALVLGFLFSADFRRRPQALVGILVQAGRASATILVAVAAVGIIIGIMNQTGLGQRFANVILVLAGDTLIGALLVMMGGCLVLGMGMPTVPAYLIIVLVVGPVIAKLGVPVLLVHLFAVYFGVLSAVTPPVALAAYAAAPITGASPMATAVTAVRIALIGFIVPFVLVYNPSLSLVLQFEPAAFVWICVRLALAIWLLTTGLAGFEREHLAPPWRVLRLVLGTSLLLEGAALQAAALVLGLLLVGYEWRPVLRKRFSQT